MERHFKDLGVGEPADAVKFYRGVVEDAVAYYRYMEETR
jgi:hypothetical protein